MTSKTSKAVLVTGANKGIGLGIVNAILAEHEDTHVLLGARDPQRGAAARESIAAEHPEWAERVTVVPLDVTDAASVSAAAEATRSELDARGEALVGVVNNAGIGWGSYDRATVLDVNARGIRRVCDAFVPLLDADAGRIVNVTSASGPSFVAKCSAERQSFFLNSDVDWKDLDAFISECAEADDAAFSDKGLADGDPYGLSTACANTLTLMLAREHPNLKINACTPGFIETDLTRPYAESSGKAPAELGMKSPAEGARSPMHLLFGELEGNGRYYGSDAQRSPLDRYRSPGDPPYAGD